jgi:hypothetical protein
MHVAWTLYIVMMKHKLLFGAEVVPCTRTTKSLAALLCRRNTGGICTITSGGSRYSIEMSVL